MSLHQHANVTFDASQGVLRCSGSWTVTSLSTLEKKISRLAWPPRQAVIWDGSEITALDTGGAVLLHRCMDRLRQQGYTVSWVGLREEFAELLNLVAENAVALASPVSSPKLNWLARIGAAAWTRAWHGIGAMTFLGESTMAAIQAVRSPRSLRWRMVLRSLELDGFHALPIIGLLSFLMGVVIAYQGAEQLRTLGANIFIVDLVGIALLREIAPLITAILVAGRSGSAHTAQIGTMRVTEELDAVRILGISPLQYLVLPKVLALLIALPLLTVYADVLGVLGGMAIATNQLNIGTVEFLSRFEHAIAVKHYLIGIVKAPVFAAIIALVGCYQGFQIHGGVDSVGQRTTISVVQSIFLVIVFDALFSIVLNWWGI